MMELRSSITRLRQQTTSWAARSLMGKRATESRGRLENVQELKSNIVSFLENDPEDATLLQAF